MKRSDGTGGASVARPRPPHLPQFPVIDELRTVPMDERAEAQTVLPAETDTLQMRNFDTTEQKPAFLRHKNAVSHSPDQTRSAISWDPLWFTDVGFKQEAALNPRDAAKKKTDPWPPGGTVSTKVPAKNITSTG